MTRPSGDQIRVLQVIAGLDPMAGGPTTSAVTTALALRRLGVIASFAYVVAPSREPATKAYAELLRAAGVDVYRFHVAPGSGERGTRWGISLSLAGWLLRNARRFDVIHVHGAWTFTTASGLAAARLGGRVAVLSAHESLTDFDRRNSGALKRVVKLTLRRIYFSLFDLVVMASSLEQRDSANLFERPGAIVPHAVSSIEPAFREAVDGRLRIGFLGRLHPKKNLEPLLHSIADVAIDAQLIVAGDGPGAYVDRLRHLAHELGISDRITWLGFVDGDEKGSFLGSIDLLAMPSEYESFGIAAVEAMSAGVPVIVSPTVGVADVVASGKAGLVVPPTSEQLTAAIRAFADDPAFLKSARARARRTAETFSLSRHAVSMRREYFRLLNHEPDGAHRRKSAKPAPCRRAETEAQGVHRLSDRCLSTKQTVADR